MAKVLIDVPEIPKNDHQRWVLTHGGIVLDGLTNGEVIQKMFPDVTISFEEEWDSYDNGDICHPYVERFVNVDFGYEQIITFNLEWWNRKWGE